MSAPFAQEQELVNEGRWMGSEGDEREAEESDTVKETVDVSTVKHRKLTIPDPI